MANCPKCGSQLPDEAHFCMHCFTSLDEEAVSKVEKSAKSIFSDIVYSKAFKIGLISFAFILVLGIGGFALKKAVKLKNVVPADEIVTVTVTDKNGEAVTQENGETLTQIAVEVTDENGEGVTDESGLKVYQAVVPVTDANGEAITDKSGESVFETVTVKAKVAEETTTKKSFFSQFFGKNDNTIKPSDPNDNTKPSSSATSTALSQEDTNTTTRETKTTDSATTGNTQTTTQITTQTTTQPTKKTDINDFSYTESNGVITITKYNGNDSYVTVPAYIDGKPVKHVGEGAFSNNANIQTIFFESGTHSFQFLYFTNIINNLPNLKEIVFPKNIDSYSLGVDGKEYLDLLYFYKTIENCNNISGVYFGSKSSDQDGVVYSRGYVLAYYPPAKTDSFYEIRQNCNKIDGAAFQNNPYLKHLKINSDLKYINTGRDSKQYNFLGCTALEKFSVADGNNYYSAKDGVLYYRPDGTMNGVTYYSFHYPPAKKDKYFETIDQPIIVSHTFYGNPYIETIKLSKVYFQDVTQLRGNASSPVNLKKIILKAEPQWYYTQKLKEYGIEYEITS